METTNITNLSLGRSRFIISDSYVYSVGEDQFMKKINLGVDSNMPELADSESEMYAIEKVGDLVYIGGEEKIVERWKLVEGQMTKIGTLFKFEGQINDIKVSPDSKFLLVVGENELPVLFDLEKEQLSKPAQGHESGIASGCWSPDSQFFATSGKDGRLNLYNRDLSLVKKIKIGNEIKDDLVRNQAQFDHNGDILLAGGNVLRSLKKGSWDLEFKKVKTSSDISIVEPIRDNSGMVCVAFGSKFEIWGDEKVGEFECEGTVIDVHSRGKEVFVLDEDGDLTRTRIEQVVKKKKKMLDLNEFRQVEADGEEGEVEEEIKVDDVEVTESDLPSDLAPVKESKKNEERDHFKIYQELKQIQENAEIPEENMIMEEEPTTGGMEEEQIPEVKIPKRRGIVMDEEEDHTLNPNFTQDQEEEEELQELAQHIPIQIKTNRNDPRAQKPFTVNSTALPGSRNYLTWNMSGKVIFRRNGLEDEFGVEDFLDIEYSLGQLSKRTIPNVSNYSMAAINYQGTLLASEGYVLKEDEYEDDELDDELKKAKILFVPAKNERNGWEIKLNPSENIKAIAQGNLFSCVFTNKNFVRFFSPEGKEFFILGASHIITMTAYDNLLALLYHGSSPFSGEQCLRVKIFNTSNLRVSIDTAVNISQNSEVKWFGFSNQGNIFLQDTANILWALTGRHSWSPVLEQKLWIVGIDEESAYAIKLGYGEEEPNPLANLSPKAYDLKIPFTAPDYNTLSLGIIQREQMKFRKDIWGHMAHCSVKTPQDTERSRMPDEGTCNKEKLKKDKLIINFCREKLIAEKEDEALWLALQIESEKAFEACCKLVAGMNKPQFLERLRDCYQKLGSRHYLKEKSRVRAQPFRDITELEKKYESRLKSIVKNEQYAEKFGSQTKKMGKKSFKSYKKEIGNRTKMQEERIGGIEPRVSLIFFIFKGQENQWSFWEES